MCIVLNKTNIFLNKIMCFSLNFDTKCNLPNGESRTGENPTCFLYNTEPNLQSAKKK